MNNEIKQHMEDRQSWTIETSSDAIWLTLAQGQPAIIDSSTRFAEFQILTLKTERGKQSIEGWNSDKLIIILTAKKHKGQRLQQVNSTNLPPFMGVTNKSMFNLEYGPQIPARILCRMTEKAEQTQYRPGREPRMETTSETQYNKQADEQRENMEEDITEQRPYLYLYSVITCGSRDWSEGRAAAGLSNRAGWLVD